MAANLDQGVASRERELPEGKRWPGKSTDVKNSSSSRDP